MAQATAISDARLPAYVRLRDQMAARIASSEWAPGVALPSENMLAREHNLSVGTVRRSIQQLVGEGLLERRQGAGTYLRKPAFDATLFRFFQVHDGSGQTIPQSRLFVRVAERASDSVAAILGTRDVLRIERLRSLGGRPLLSEEIFIPADRFRGFETLDEDELGPLLYPVYLERFGVFVARAEDEVSFGEADAITARRLDVATGDPIAIIERTAFAMDGTPIEWRVACGSARRFRYCSRIG